MGVLKKRRSKHFTQIDNSAINDKSLSWKALGIYTYLMSKPDEWKYYLSEICLNAKDGKDSTVAGIKELEIAGYLVRHRVNNPDGKFDYDYEIFDEPQKSSKPLGSFDVAKKPHMDSPRVDSPHVEIPTVVKSASINTDILNNTDLSNIELSNPYSPQGDTNDSGNASAMESFEGSAQKESDANSKPSPQIHPLLERIIRIFMSTNRKLRLPRPPKDVAAWKKISNHVTEEDVDLIEKFYALRKPKEYDERWNRKTTAETLMNNWGAQCDLAQKYFDLKPERDRLTEYHAMKQINNQS